MIDHELVKKYFVGRDGFIWWIGQIAPEKKWSPNISGRRVSDTSQIKGFGDRYKVRILGYHDISDDTPLKDDDLPWAQVMLPVTAGSGSAGASQSVSLHQGTYVYGFFLDGEDAQQPVIMGILGFNQYTQVSKQPTSTSSGATKFLPFDGQYGVGKDDKVPEYNIRENPQSSPAITGELVVPSKNKDSPKPSATGLVKTDPQESTTDNSSAKQKNDGENPSSLPKPQRCESESGMPGIATEIFSTLQKIQEIQAKANSWVAAVNGRIDNIQEQIDSQVQALSEKIAGYVKWIIDSIRDYTIKLIEDKSKDLYYLVFPNQRQAVKETQSELMDKISCLIDKIIGGLIGLVGSALSNLVGKFLNVTSCLVENFLGSLLGNVLGGLVSGIQSIVDSVQGVLGAIGSASSIVDSVVGFIKDLLSFGGAFSCQEDHSCPEVEEWSIWKGAKSANELLSSFDSIEGLIDQAKGIGDQVFSVASNVSGSILNVKESVNGVVKKVKNSGRDISDAVQNSFSNGCDAGPVQCGPPTVGILGGGGFGAAANAVIGSSGEILAVDIIDRGFGFNSEPTVYVKDACGKGKGAKLKVKMRKRVVSDRRTRSSGESRIRRNRGERPSQLGGAGYGGGGTITVFPSDEKKKKGKKSKPKRSGRKERGPRIVRPGIIKRGKVIGKTSDRVRNLQLVKEAPTVTLSVSPYPITEAGNDITLTWKAENATGIVTSNFPTGGFLEGSCTISDFNKNKTFIITADNKFGQTTAALFVGILGTPIGGDLEIDEIIVEDPGTGYLQTPDGTRGSVGKTWSTKDDTIVQDPDGTWLPPIPPGEFVKLPTGSKITPPNVTSGFGTDTSSGLGEYLQLFPGGVTTVVKEEVIITTQPAPVSNDPKISDDLIFTVGDIRDLNPPQFSDGQYGVVLELIGIDIIDGGVNYDDKIDTISLSPSNGVNASIKTGPFGKIEKVEIINNGSGFKEYPEVLVNTQTGFNAELIPVFGVKRVGIGSEFDLALEQINNGTPIITVIDCTSQRNFKQNSSEPII